MKHYYTAHLLADGTTEYLNCNGKFINELTNDTISTTDAESALALAGVHDALALVTTDDSGFQPI
jgi:hypothetical protein